MTCELVAFREDVHRRLIARRWSFGKHGDRETGYRMEIRRLVVQMATENPRWGYSRIRGALRNLEHRVARSTVARILKEEGIEPSPKRPTPWSTFLRAHWGHIVATDFLTVDVWTPMGLATRYVLFFMDLKTRRSCTRRSLAIPTTSSCSTSLAISRTASSAAFAPA